LPPATGPAPDDPDNAHMPSCPSGQFCMTEANAVGSPMAAAPFGKCAESARDPLAPMGRQRFVSFNPLQTKRERTAKKDACCYEWTIPCPGGRPLLVDGAPRVAPPRSEAAWVGRTTSLFAEHCARSQRMPAAVREALARHYEREASFEHASVAAFARVSLALLSAGAPPDLVADTHRAALDEIAHAEAMYLLASGLRGAPVGPSPLDVSGATAAIAGLEDIAAEALLEGCAGEVTAVLVLREEADRAEDETLRATLERMAADEERHAELAWRTVAWTMRSEPASVGERLARVRASLGEELATPLSAEGFARSLPGVTSAVERIVLRRRALADVVLPCLDTLLARRCGSAGTA
jgi:hypothetical protein